MDIYYKFIISNLKKESNNIDIKSLNYKFLYKYCQSYDGSLLSDLEQYMTENFEKKLEGKLSKKYDELGVNKIK